MGWFRRLHGAKPWRAIGAWLLACYVSGVLITAGFVVYSSLSAGFNNDTRSVADIVLMAHARAEVARVQRRFLDHLEARLERLAGVLQQHEAVAIDDGDVGIVR